LRAIAFSWSSPIRWQVVALALRKRKPLQEEKHHLFRKEDGLK